MQKSCVKNAVWLCYSFASVFAGLAIFAPALGDDEPQFSGSLYPSETALEAKNAIETVSYDAAIKDPKLAKALGGAAFIVAGSGQQAEFQALIQRAVAAHPAFHAQTTTLDETEAERRRAKSALYPQLSTQLRGDYSLTRDFAADTDNVVESLRPREQFTAGLSASQLIFDGGAALQRIRSARARSAEFENSLSARVNEIALNALAVYHDLAVHRALVELGEAFIRRHEKILGDVKERERLGAGARADITRTQARLAAARARVAEIRESAQLAEIRYYEFFKESPFELQRPSITAAAIRSREEAISAAIINNPQIAAATARSKSLTADYHAAKGARYPEVRLSVDAVKFDVFDGGDDFDVRAGVNINYNIFGGGARAAEISAARARARRERFGEEQIRQEIARDAAIAFERRNGAENRLTALAQAFVAHDETRKLVLERYRVARGDLIDVLQAENDFFEAGVAYLMGLSNRDLAIYALMEHTGDLLRFYAPQNTENYFEPSNG